jgi:hypothetical protein
VRRFASLALAVSLLGPGGAAPAAAQTGLNPAQAQPAPAPAQPAPPAPQPPPAQAAQPAQPSQAEPAAPSPQTEDKDVEQSEESGEGGNHNIVNVQNHVDSRFLMRGRVDLTHVGGQNASPANRAEAFASCTGCQTFAVALQIALIRRDARTIAPENAAIAVNVRCNGCFTSARAVQYVFQVDDPEAIPERDNELIHRMNDELQAIRQTQGITPQQANSRIDAVIAEFSDLANSLNDQRQDTDVEDS